MFSQKPFLSAALVLFLLASPSAQAIRSVGNGGGLAEMRVVYLFQNLNRFLRVCLTPANACHISNETFLDWSLIFSEKSSAKNDYLVSFETELPEPKGYVLDGLKLKISHNMLYLDLNSPKNFNELLAFVISVKQDLIGSRLSFADNLQIAQLIFKDLKMEESSHKVAGLPSLLSLSQLKVFDGVTHHLIVGLEDEEKTINLSEAISKSLPCGILSDWNFTQWSSSVHSSRLYFYGFAQAICDGKLVQKRIMIKATVNTQWLIDEKTLQVNFFIY